MGLLATLLGLKSSKTAHERAGELEQRMQRLCSSDWVFYEQHLQRPIPAALKRLFANEALIRYAGKPLESGEIYVTSFEPIDREAVVDAKEWLGFEVVPFASSDGDLIYLRPGAQEPNCVYITYHDGGDTEVLAESAEAFAEAVELAGANAI